MRSAGCIYNDIIDRDIDAKVARTQARPLASGQISLTSAIVLILALCLVGLAVLVQFNVFAICLGFASVGIVLIYPLDEARNILAASLSRPRLLLGRADGMGREFGALDLAPVLLYVSARLLDNRLRYDLCASGQRGRCAHRAEVHGAALWQGYALWLSLFYGVTLGGLAFSGWMVGRGWYSSPAWLWRALTSSGRSPRSIRKTLRTVSTAFAAIMALAQSSSLRCWRIQFGLRFPPDAYI